MNSEFAKFSQEQETNLKQIDEFNCGVVMLMYVNTYLNDQVAPTASKVAMKRLRLKYFVKAIEFFAPGVVVTCLLLFTLMCSVTLCYSLVTRSHRQHRYGSFLARSFKQKRT